MQKLETMGLLGLGTPESAPTGKFAHRAAEAPIRPLGARTLSLREAEEQMTSAAPGTAPGDRVVPTVPRPSAPVSTSGTRRTPPAAADSSPVAPEVPPTRDADGALWITERQAAGPLPAGRYKYRTRSGSVTTVETGESACLMGRKLRLHARANDAVVRHLEHERAIQESWFKGERC